MRQLDQLPDALLRQVAQIDYFIAENAKTARAFLNGVAEHHRLRVALQSIEIVTLNVSTLAASIPALLEPILKGRTGALLSEAGAPAVADPGAELVALAHRRGISVRPLVGPSAILLALMASGLNGQRFAFHGYLPIDSEKRNIELKRLEHESRVANQTQIAIETPYRNDAFLNSCISALNGSTRLCVAANLTLGDEIITSKSVAAWKRETPQPLKGKPAVFLFLAGSAPS